MTTNEYLDDLLDELVPRERDAGSWSDVLGRARRARRRYVLVAVALATLVLAPASWAVANAFEGSAPPEAITAGVISGNELAPQVVAAAKAQGWPNPESFGATADVSKLHGVMQVQTPDGPLDLWAAPSSNGGVCEFIGFEVDLPAGRWDGGCINPPLTLVAPSLEGESWHPNLWTSWGYTSIPEAATATMSLTDGQSVTVPVVEGWFLATFHRTTDVGVNSAKTTIEDASGNQLAQYQEPPFPNTAANRRADSNDAAVGATTPPSGGTGLRVCGPRKSIAVKNALAQNVPTEYVAGLRAATPARPQSFYKIQLNVSHSCDVSFPNAPIAFFIPAAAEIRILNSAGGAFWVRLPRHLNNVLRQAVHGVKAFPAPTKLTSAAINHLLAAEPSSYLRLYTIGTAIRRAPRADGWHRITLTGPSTPWSDGWNSLWISRRADYLRRDGQLVRIPASVAKRIRQAAPIPQ